MISERFISDEKPAFYLSELQKKYIRIFRDKCAKGTYTFRKRVCECGCQDFEILAQKDRYGIPMDTVICRNCGLIMSNPCLDDASNNEFYDNEYPYIYRAEDKPSEEEFQRTKREIGFAIVLFIQKHTGKMTGNVLEIGCADGRNVAAFSERGYEACGIDLSHSYIAFGKEKGLNLFCCSAEEFAKRGVQFDIIVLNHVLEHFTDLKKELGIIKKLLKPDGYLYIGVPGLRALTYGEYNSDFLLMLQNAHIFNFTKGTLCEVLSRYGFEQVFCNEMIVGVFKLSNNIKKQYLNDYYPTNNYLRLLENHGDDTMLLLQERIEYILSQFGEKEVVLYGTADELDMLIASVSSISSIKGFFYSEKETLYKVVEYLYTCKDVKCLIIADINRNLELSEQLTNALKDSYIEIYSAYTELY